MDAKTFKSERKRVGLTLEEVGKAMGISKQSVSHWEKENRPIPIVRQEQAKEIFANPKMYKIPKVKKVYLVWCEEDNLMDYDDYRQIDYVIAVCSSKEKAKAYARSWKPVLNERQSMVDNPSHVESNYGIERDFLEGTERVIYIHSEDPAERALCMLTIDEREIDK